MAKEAHEKLDALDRKMLQMLSTNGSMSFQSIADKLSISKSTVHNRVNKLQDSGVIKGFYALLDPEKLGNNMTAISLVRGRYGPEYSQNIGDAISRIRGVWAVYFVMGDVDFIVLIRCRTKKELSGIIEQFSKTEGVERSSTFYVLDRLKENYNESVLLDDVVGAETVRSPKKKKKR